MFCPNCGSQLPEGAKFCMTCGHKIPGQPEATRPRQAQSSGPVRQTQSSSPVRQTQSSGMPRTEKKKGNLFVSLAVMAVAFLAAKYLLAPMLVKDMKEDASVKAPESAVQITVPQENKEPQSCSRIFEGVSGEEEYYCMLSYEDTPEEDDRVKAIWMEIDRDMTGASQSDHDQMDQTCRELREMAAGYGISELDFLCEYSTYEVHDVTRGHVFIYYSGDGDTASDLEFLRLVFDIDVNGNELRMSDAVNAMIKNGLTEK